MLIKSKSQFILSDGLISYQKNNKWYVPMEDLFDAIGVNYNFIKNERVIKGFIFKEENSYKIDLNKCELFLVKKNISFDCTDFIPLDEFLIVNVSVIEKITDIKFKIDSLGSSIILDYYNLFPPEEKNKRSGKKYGNKKKGPKYPETKVARDWMDGANFDQDITIDSFRSRDGKTRSSIRHETSLSAEILKSELYTDYRGIDKKTESFWLGLERNDHRERILGDVGLSEIKLANFNMPTNRLVGGGQKLTGLYFSNRSLYKALNFTKEDFVGHLEKDWEVELYHNELLIGRHVGSSDNQRYEFLGVDLYYGMNRFKFVFYGPKGERRYESKNLNITDSFSKTNKVLNVTGAYGIDNDDRENYSLSLSKNIFKRFQLEVNTVREYDYKNLENNHYLGGSLSTFFNSTLMDINVLASDGHNAIETGMKFNLSGISTNLSYINNSGLKSQELGQTNPIDYSWNGNFLLPLKFIRNLQSFNRVKYKKKEGIEEKFVDLLNRMSFSHRNFYISNSISVENTIFSDELFARYTWGKSSLKLKNKWGSEGLRDSEIAYSFSNRRENSFNANLTYDYQGRRTNLRLRADKRFQSLFAGISLEANNRDEYGAGINLSYGAIYDEDIGIKFYNKRTTDYANIKVSAFHDVNNDGVRNDDENLINNIEFFRLSGNERESTDHNGYAFFSFVQPLQPTDIKISLGNIENIYLRPTIHGKRVWGRAGKTAELEFPLQIMGDVEGEVEFLNNNTKKVTAKIFKDGKVFKVIQAEKDGYFYSDGILPGEYTLKISCEECAKKEFVKDFSMPIEGDSLFFEGVKI